jgi:hypothetical protein
MCSFVVGVFAQNIGKVMFVSGEVALVRGGQPSRVNKGDLLQEGDVIKTELGKLQLVFIDGAVFALQPHSQFEIKKYQLDKNNPLGNISQTKLIEGGLRTITGSIPKANRAGYQLETATGVIGVRGTEIVIQDDLVQTIAGIVGVDLTNTSGSPRSMVLPAEWSVRTSAFDDAKEAQQDDSRWTKHSDRYQDTEPVLNKPALDAPFAAPIPINTIGLVEQYSSATAASNVARPTSNLMTPVVIPSTTPYVAPHVVPLPPLVDFQIRNPG